MPTWTIHALLSLLGFSSIYILLKILTLFKINAIIINFWFFASLTLGFLVFAVIRKVDFAVPKSSLIVFLALALVGIFGNHYYVRAYEAAPNPGYVDGIISFATVVLVLFSFFFLGSSLTAAKLLGIVLVVSGVLLLTFS
ncbi:MAG: EamA family transporter [Gammaproteobacteria bacterium]|nr:EamA family transporter [Gammaproteobacteria bacterium]